ncbi:MAG: hypothetical protein P4L99_02970 [Chthoniobacter sp.]|nr:hypothetical protein [Chthoniobacter sp.]
MRLLVAVSSPSPSPDFGRLAAANLLLLLARAHHGRLPATALPLPPFSPFFLPPLVVASLLLADFVTPRPIAIVQDSPAAQGPRIDLDEGAC